MNNQIVEFFTELAGRPVAYDEDVIVNGVLDSFAFVQLIELIEHSTGSSVNVLAVGVDKFRTIESIMAFVNSLQNKS